MTYMLTLLKHTKTKWRTLSSPPHLERSHQIFCSLKWWQTFTHCAAMVGVKIVSHFINSFSLASCTTGVCVCQISTLLHQCCVCAQRSNGSFLAFHVTCSMWKIHPVVIWPLLSNTKVLLFCLLPCATPIFCTESASATLQWWGILSSGWLFRCQISAGFPADIQFPQNVQNFWDSKTSKDDPNKTQCSDYGVCHQEIFNAFSACTWFLHWLCARQWLGIARFTHYGFKKLSHVNFKQQK